jgi:hypothetical protein
MPFTNAALYWRDNASHDGITADPANLGAPQQIEFNDSDEVLASVREGEQPNVSEDPAYDSGGDLVVEKQFNGSYGYSLTLTIVTEPSASGATLRKKIRTFYRKIQIEPAHHEFGIFGFSHPSITDFNVDPTDRYGFTMDTPTHEFVHGGKLVKTTVVLRIGGHIDEIP